MIKFNYKYFKIALKEARKALSFDEVPVGAVLVDNISGEILAKSYNQMRKKNCKKIEKFF